MEAVATILAMFIVCYHCYGITVKAARITRETNKAIPITAVTANTLSTDRCFISVLSYLHINRDELGFNIRQ